MKQFTWTGWEIKSAEWRVDNYQCSMEAKNGLLSAVACIVLDGECEVIDKDVYQNSGRVIKLNKLKY